MNGVKITRRRIFDWRMNISLCLLVTVLLLVFGYINSAREMAVKDQQVATGAQQQALSNRQISALIAELGAERQISASNQQIVVDYAYRVSIQQAGLVAWLRQQHIKVPTRFVEVIPAPTLAPEPAPISTSPVPKGSSKSATKVKKRGHRPK